METSLDRKPLQGSLTLLAGAALYTMLLLQAVALQGGLRQPAFLASWIADPQARFWTWDQFTHTLVVLLVSLPCAWALTRLYTRRLLPAALLLVAPTLAWMGIDYLSLRDALPPPPAVDFFYSLDALKVLLTLPLLVLLLRHR